MAYVQIARIISIAVIIIGLLVMIGWFTENDDLKRLSPDWVSMKFSTATSFLMSGIILLLMNESRNKNSEFSRIVLFAPLIIVLFFMATLLVSTILGTTSGVSQLFVKEDPSEVLKLDKAGMPSVGTMVNFLLIIGAGFTYLLTHVKHTKYLKICGGIILSVAVIALLGYAINSPVMYYGIEGFSGAIAVHTAIAFVLLGVSMILFSIPSYKSENIVSGKISMKVSAKLVFFFLISAIIPIIVVGSISFDLAQTSLQKEYLVAVNEQADLHVDRIESFFFDRKADALVTSEIEIFKEEIGVLNEFHLDPSNKQYLESDTKLDERLKIIRNAYGYDNIMLTNSLGEIIFVSKNDSKEKYLGKSFLEIEPDTFNKGKSGVYISDVIEDFGGDGDPEMYVSAPISDHDENFLGVLIFDIKIKKNLEELVQDGYVGNTGEMVITKKTDERIFALSSLRFDLDAQLEREIVFGEAILPGQLAAEGQSGAGVSTDYRGKEVIAAWKHIPSLDWGIVSKIDTDEAFIPIFQLQQDITVLAVVFMIGIGFFGVAASRTISNPLTKLKDMAEKISKGELDAKVTIQSTDEIGQLSKMMNETGEKLKNAQKEKEEFVAMITHDLKQPLVPIQGNAELLKNPKMGELNEMQKDCVEEIQANASRQLSMIDNLVSAQKLGAGAMKYDIEELSSKAILAECIKTHSPAMADKNIEYFESSTEDIKIKGDNRRIVESFTNLILNAHDFVPESGKIEIGVTNGEKEVTFFCKDNGEGIPKEKQEQLFKKYGQVKSGAKRKFGGTGLGLAVSQELVEGMSGRIWLESEEGKGATFFFTIPKV